MTPRHISYADARRLPADAGSSLIEVVVSLGILATVAAGLLSMAAIALTQTENQGHLAARTAEYAQDKMEQLLALVYTDAVTNTVFFPAAPTGGTGLAVGGSLDTTMPVNGYVDWLEQDGDLLFGGTTPPAAWFYERVWQISQLTAGVKQVSVTATVKSAVGDALVPKSTVVALKSSRF